MAKTLKSPPVDAGKVQRRHKAKENTVARRTGRANVKSKHSFFSAFSK